MTVALAAMTALCVAALATWWATALAPRAGLVAQPSGERWHRRATPLLGGLGILAGLLAGLAVAWAGDAASGRRLLGLAAGAGLAFLVGLLDDLRALGVWQKLAGQALAAGVTVPVADVRLDLGLSGPVETVASVVVLVAVMNAVNLLDNMDGVAASVAALGAAALALLAAGVGHDDVVVLALVLAAACGGFLTLNLPLPRARIFMGDCGSLPLGLGLGAACVLLTGGGAGGSGAERLVPLAALFVPALDSVVVLVRRRRMGRPLTHGGRDHLAHRLVMRGMSERTALLALVGLAAATGAAAALLSRLELALGAAVLLAAAFAVLAVVLARVPPPPPAFERARERSVRSS